MAYMLVNLVRDMAKVNISFRVHPWHYKALQQEIARGKKLTQLFEDLLDERFPMSFHQNRFSDHP